MSWIPLKEIIWHDRLSAEFPEGASYIVTRSWEWCGASKGLGLARRVLAKCFFGKGIKLPGFSVSFDLAVPNLPVELQEPLAKLRELLRRKVLDLAFNSLDLAHFTHLPHQYTTRPSRSATLPLSRGGGPRPVEPPRRT